MGGMAAAGAGTQIVGAHMTTAGKFMSRPKKVKYPPFREQELDLLRRQNQLAFEGRGLLEGGAGQYQNLTPSLYELAGVRPTYTSNAAQLANAEQAYNDLYGQFFAAKQAVQSLKQSGKKGKALKSAKKTRKQLKAQLPLAEREVGYYRTNPLTITGFEPMQPSEEDLLQDPIQLALAQKTLAGLQGNLPDDPRLLRELGEQERMLREDLQRRLGPDYELSTPGSEALANFKQRRAELLSEMQRRDVLTYRPLELRGGESLQQMDARQMGMLAGIPFGQSRLGANFVDAASAYGNMTDPYAMQRARMYQAQLRNSQVPSKAAAALLVSGEGHQQVGEALSMAGGLGGGGGGGGGGLNYGSMQPGTAPLEGGFGYSYF